MTNLFSIFDPSTQILNLPLNWLSIALPLMTFPYSFWLLPSRSKTMIMSIIMTLKTEFKLLLGPVHFPSATILLISLLTMILINNTFGLIPYIFTATSHPLMTISMALPLWLAFILYGWINHLTHMLAHLVPQGTPTMLMSFMVCIETISNIIRPLTLSIRLAANMIAGHLLLTLLGNQGPSSSIIILPLILTTQIMLLTLESAVALIQSYVFAVLSTLYASETS
uniref:ATP synthase subunit a n=1 Tax=Abacion magnum TaxID=118452 RepID=S4SZH5_ABAMA|nr:ATP synthase F0 subunit 6 [Abacion magnum]AFR77014.1 ATP synthetase F0 Subunit 6 [Abacion magnum]